MDVDLTIWRAADESALSPSSFWYVGFVYDWFKKKGFVTLLLGPIFERGEGKSSTLRCR